jgi:hypothetical protein
MLTDLVRLWGTSRMVTGVRILFRNIRARFIATSFNPMAEQRNPLDREEACNRHSRNDCR